jgi:hypothetical protein
MDASKPEVRLVEGTGQKPIPVEKTSEISLGSPAADQYRTALERRAEGKALRKEVPREAHGGWKPRKVRRNPVELLLESNEGRLPELGPIRHGRMVQSPFAFFRGSAALMASDLAHKPNSGLRVQVCGDAHLMNFGAFATPERNVIFDINDFDETLPGPWEWDLKRLAASVVIAGTHLKLPESESSRAAIAMARSYREHMADYVVDASTGSLVRPDRYGALSPGRPSEEIREQIEERIEKTRARTVPEHDYPKLVEHHGAIPRIKENRRLYFIQRRSKRRE